MQLLSSTTASSACRRRYGTAHVGLVALADIALDLLQRHVVALGAQFVVTAAGPHLGVGRHENLQFGVGEYHRADVAAVHHHAAAASHLLLHGHQLAAHGRNGAHLAHAVADLDRPDFALRQIAVHVDVAGAAFGIEPERDRNLVEQPDDRVFIDDARTDRSVFERIERHGAVHGARVDENVAQTPGDGFGERALSARRESVYGDYDLVFSIRHWGIYQGMLKVSCKYPVCR